MSDIKWFDIQRSRKKWRVFNFFLGGRGIGKTYSAFSYAFQRDLKFIYLRSTETQIKTCLSPDRGNPFKKWAADHKRRLFVRSGEDINDIIEIIYGDAGEEKEKSHGFACSLSTFENLRGADFSEIDLIIYDEFIQIKTLNYDAFRAFLNLYESVNRNRELEEREAVRVFFLANTQELNSPILAGFDLIGDIESTQNAGQKKFSRGDIYVEMCDSEVSAAKEKSVLYRNLRQDDAYKREAISNQFSRNDFSGIKKPKNMREYKPLCMIDDITIWKHKSVFQYYCARQINNKVPRFNSKNQRGLFWRHYGGALSDAYARNVLLCDSFVTRTHLVNVLNLD